MAEMCVICGEEVKEFREWRNLAHYSGIVCWSPGVYSPTRYASEDREYGGVCGKCVESNDFGICPICKQYNDNSTFYPHICFRCEQEAERFGLSNREFEARYRGEGPDGVNLEILRLKHDMKDQSLVISAVRLELSCLKHDMKDQSLVIPTLSDRISELERRNKR